MASVELKIKPVTKENYREIMALKVKESQADFIESNAISLVEAAYDTDLNWYPFGLYLKGNVVGFAMMGAEDKTAQSIWLDRFMIADTHQHLGLGGRFLEELKKFIYQNWQVKTIYLSYHPTNTLAENFYLKYGFKKTGKLDEVFHELILAYHF